MPREIPFSSPDITEAEIEAVTDALRSGRLQGGPRQARFEELVTERTQRRHGVAVSSGTAALHLALVALEVGPEDEVITSPFSAIAAANCVLYVGARPVFVDIDPVALNMDPRKVEAAITERTKAIIAPITFGNPMHLDQLAALARRYEIPLIEEACSGLGGRYKGQPVGSFGRISVFSFQAHQLITTCEGGMLVTDDDRIADICRCLRDHGRPESGGFGEWGPINHERLGFSYRMSEMAAALGVMQMERLNRILQRRHDLAHNYFERLMDLSELILPTVDGDTEMSWSSFVVRLTDQFNTVERDRILKGVRRHDIGCAPGFPPIHLQPFYRSRFGYQIGDFPVTESVAQRAIALPFYNQLNRTGVDLVALTLRMMIQRECLLKQDPKSQDPPDHPRLSNPDGC